MNDRELLELAAKAAGIPGVYVEVHGMDVGQDACGIGRPNARWGDALWNPLTDDSDALRLAVKLGFSVNQVQGRQQASCISPTDVRGAYVEPYDGDPYAATRRVIVKAAAEVGKAMP